MTSGSESPLFTALQSPRHEVILLFVVLFLPAIATPTRAQNQQQPLNLDQIEKLIQIGTPDAAIAREIHRRGLSFSPGPDTIDQLRRAGAGREAMLAISEKLPKLDDAKREIPEVLKKIYDALDKGNPSASRDQMSTELASDFRKLDAICKPFTYRAHYVEAIIERPQGRFEVRTRALFKPLEERAYALWFDFAGGRARLTDVSDPPDDWVGPTRLEALEITRRFIYAARASQTELLYQMTTPTLNNGVLGRGPLSERVRSIEKVEVDHAEMVSDRGFKFHVPGISYDSGRCSENWDFLVDRISDQTKIVRWTIQVNGYGCDTATFQTEDSKMEAYTLARFGLSTLPSASAASNPQLSSNVTEGANSPKLHDYVEKADRYLNEKEYAEALTQYRHGLLREPANPDLLSGKAVAEAGVGDYSNAEEDGEKAIAAGGALRFPIVHNHVTGYCAGDLILERGKLTFQPQSGQHGFSVTSSGQIDITESTFTMTNLPEFLVHWRGQDGKDHKYYMVITTYLTQTTGRIIPQVFHANGDAADRTTRLDRMILRLIKKSVPETK